MNRSAVTNKALEQIITPMHVWLQLTGVMLNGAENGKHTGMI